MALTKVTGEFIDISDLDLSDVGTISLDAIQGDADSNTSITFSGSDVITIATGGSGRLTIGDGALSPVTDNQIDLGTSSLEFKDAFFDGTVTADAFAGPLTGNVTGNASGTALTVTQAAQSAITSLGSLTALTGSAAPFVISNVSNGNNIDIKTTSGGSLVHAVKIHSGGVFEAKQGAVFNEDSNDVDFRVESNNNANMLFVDGGNDRVGIGTATFESNEILRVAKASGNHHLTMLAADDSSNSLRFKNASGNTVYCGMFGEVSGGIGKFGIYNNGLRMVVDTSGNVGIGLTGPSAKLQVQTTTGIGLKISQTLGSHGGNPAIHLVTEGAYGDCYIRFNEDGESKSWALGTDDTENGFSLTYAASNTAAPTTSPALFISV